MAAQKTKKVGGLDGLEFMSSDNRLVHPQEKEEFVDMSSTSSKVKKVGQGGGLVSIFSE